jgi:hypothetical protein
MVAPVFWVSLPQKMHLACFVPVVVVRGCRRGQVRN